MTGLSFFLSIPLMFAIASFMIFAITLCREARQVEMDQRLARERAVTGE